MNSPETGKAERTRRFIIERSAPIFNQKGYAGTSLSDITRATGLTKGSIYGNFANKDEVALEAFRHNVDFVKGNILARVGASQGALQKLLAYPRTYREIFEELKGRGGCPVVNTLSEADDTHQDLLAAAREVIAGWKQGIAAIVKSGQRRGEITGDADPEAVAEAIIVLVEGGILVSKATGQDTFFRHAMDQAEAMIRGLAAE